MPGGVQRDGGTRSVDDSPDELFDEATFLQYIQHVLAVASSDLFCLLPPLFRGP